MINGAINLAYAEQRKITDLFLKEKAPQPGTRHEIFNERPALVDRYSVVAETSGNLIVVAATHYLSSIPASAITDNKGNTYAKNVVGGSCFARCGGTVRVAGSAVLGTT